jgi:hypothetical protein
MHNTTRSPVSAAASIRHLLTASCIDSPLPQAPQRDVQCSEPLDDESAWVGVGRRRRAPLPPTSSQSPPKIQCRSQPLQATEYAAGDTVGHACVAEPQLFDATTIPTAAIEPDDRDAEHSDAADDTTALSDPSDEQELINANNDQDGDDVDDASGFSFRKVFVEHRLPRTQSPPQLQPRTRSM